MYNYYLLYNNYFEDEITGFAEFGHLLTYNPGTEDADINLTFYYEDKCTSSLKLKAFAETTTESNYATWKIEKPLRFAYKVESPVPLACQATIGWNNVMNDYRSFHEVDPRHRECVISYMAIDKLANDWYHPDCIVINMPDKIWVREPEWLILLNPGDETAEIAVNMSFENKEKKTCCFNVEPMRLKYIYMDEIAIQNLHYGIHVHSDKKIAAQWLRMVKWYNKNEVMSYWSVPLIRGPLS